MGEVGALLGILCFFFCVRNGRAEGKISKASSSKAQRMCSQTKYYFWLLITTFCASKWEMSRDADRRRQGGTTMVWTPVGMWLASAGAHRLSTYCSFELVLYEADPMHITHNLTRYFS